MFWARTFIILRPTRLTFIILSVWDFQSAPQKKIIFVAPVYIIISNIVVCFVLQWFNTLHAASSYLKTNITINHICIISERAFTNHTV